MAYTKIKAANKKWRREHRRQLVRKKHKKFELEFDRRARENWRRQREEAKLQEAKT